MREKKAQRLRNRFQFEKYGKKSLNLIEAIMLDPNTETKVRLDAAKYLCDRAYGKPTQETVLAGDSDRPLVAVIRDG